MTHEHIAYTAKESAAITEAARAIRHACDCWDWTAPTYLRDAMKDAKEGGRRGTGEARMTVINGFVSGMAEPLAADRLYGLVRGYQLAHMTGAAFARRRAPENAERVQEIQTKAFVAAAAHEAAFRRFLNRDSEAA